jgi:hypothetical protein
VLVHTPRGLELGTVLCEVASTISDATSDAGGSFVRVACTEDIRLAEEQRQRGLALLDSIASQQPAVIMLDCELLFDGRTAVLHVLPLGECDLDTDLAEWSLLHGLAFRVHDQRSAALPEEPPTGCGKPGCGSSGGGCGSCGTGGGCGTKSCSKGSVKNAEELTTKFLALRHQMEQHLR